MKEVTRLSSSRVQGQSPKSKQQRSEFQRHQSTRTHRNVERLGVDGLDERPRVLVLHRELQHVVEDVVELVGVADGLAERRDHARVHHAVDRLLQEEGDEVNERTKIKEHSFFA